ncbi:MAG: C4-type zinc ribbon domain-containing protein [Nitrospira sp.]
MKAQISLLVQIQKMDLNRSQQKNEQDHFPEKLKEAEQPLLEARAACAELKALLERVNKVRKDKEIELQVAEERIPKLKSRLTDLKTNKEYHAHLQEITTAEKDKDNIEEQLLNIMEEGDERKKVLDLKKAAMEVEEKKFNSEKKKLESGIHQVSESAKRLEGEWDSLAGQIDKNLLEDYKRLYSSRRGLAVSPVKGNICGGCHFSLPPQLVAEVKKEEKIITCSYCHRMLYANAQ